MLAVADASGNIVIQHSQPGSIGTVGQGWIEGPGNFSFDLSASKRLGFGENGNVQLRVDAENVLNKPVFGAPDLNMNSANFGRISTSQGVPNVTGNRRFQAQLRIEF
jgi:hypothetical protein